MRASHTCIGAACGAIPAIGRGLSVRPLSHLLGGICGHPVIQDPGVLPKTCVPRPPRRAARTSQRSGVPSTVANQIVLSG